MGEAKDELTRMLAEDELRDVKLLVYANKQDLPNAMPANEVSRKTSRKTKTFCTRWSFHRLHRCA